MAYKLIVSKKQFVNADLIFQEVSFSGYLFIKDEIKKPDYVFFDFGNGDELWIYRNDKESIIMRYVQPNKKDKEYLSKRVTRLITFEHLISEEWDNELWDNN